MGEKRKWFSKENCCLCLCKRNIGVMILPFYSIFAFVMGSYSMVIYGKDSIIWSIGIPLNVAIFGITLASVLFIPQCSNNKGARTCAFILWFAGVCMFWNIEW